MTNNNKKQKKKQKQEIHILNPAGNLEKVSGIKMANGKLLIDNPFYTKRIPIIERRPDT